MIVLLIKNIVDQFGILIALMGKSKHQPALIVYNY